MHIRQVAGLLHGAFSRLHDDLRCIFQQQPRPEFFGRDQGSVIGKGLQKLVVVIEPKQLKDLVDGGLLIDCCLTPFTSRYR